MMQKLITMDSSHPTTPGHPGQGGGPPPQAVLSKLLFSGWIPRAISVVVKFNIPDLLAAGPQSASTLAASAGLNADALGRVLRALTAIGLFQSHPDGTYALTQLSKLLRSDVAGNMRAMALWINRPLVTGAWDALEYSVREGSSAFQHVHGEQVFDYMTKHPDESAVFQDFMTAINATSVPALVESFSFAGVNTLIDVGGGHGTLLAAILDKNPTMQGILFDLPQVVADAQPLQKNPDVTARCRVEGGDFFAAVPRGADAVVMSGVIHDWNDARAIGILENVRAALPDNGRLFLCEQVIDGPFEQFIDLQMLVMTDGGRERTADEFRAILAAAGFEMVAVHRTKSFLSVVEGRCVVKK